MIFKRYMGRRAPYNTRRPFKIQAAKKRVVKCCNDCCNSPSAEKPKFTGSNESIRPTTTCQPFRHMLHGGIWGSNEFPRNSVVNVVNVYYYYLRLILEKSLFHIFYRAIFRKKMTETLYYNGFPVNSGASENIPQFYKNDTYVSKIKGVGGTY